MLGLEGSVAYALHSLLKSIYYSAVRSVLEMFVCALEVIKCHSNEYIDCGASSVGEEERKSKE